MNWLTVSSQLSRSLVAVSIVPMFMCCQTGNRWFILIEKGREKKGWGNTLRQKGDFLGCFYSFLQKKFGYSKWKQYLCTTRTRQASSQCLNRRVVLFYYGTLYKTSEDGKQHILARFDWKSAGSNDPSKHTEFKIKIDLFCFYACLHYLCHGFGAILPP